MENWCEYVSQDGEVRNILQFFCECEDLDESFTSLVSPAATSASTTTTTSTTARTAAWKRVFAVAQDRARVPWPGGARRVDLAWGLAAALLWLMRVVARRSTSPLQAVAVVATCFVGLGYSHLRALRRRSDSQFHVAWITLSVLGLHSRYREGVGLTLSRTDDVIVHVMLLALVSCYGHCCLVDPGSDQGELAADEVDPGAPLAGKQEEHGMVGKWVGFEDDDARGGGGGGGARAVMLEERERRRALLLRSGRCSMCKRTFRLRDHHCVWVGQCVAERNRRSFLAFLVLLAGLLGWFARRTAALLLSSAAAAAATTLGSVAGLGCEQAAWQCVVGLVRLNRGGEDVAVALYASTAAFLAAALAAQQILLVSAGLTTLELRRGRKPPPERPNQGSAASTANRSRSSQGHRYRYSWASGPKPLRPPPAAAAAAAAPAGRQPQRRVVPDLAPIPFILSARGLVENWWSFLSGTEIPAPVPGPRTVAASPSPSPSPVLLPPLPPRWPRQGVAAPERVRSPLVDGGGGAAVARESDLLMVGGSSHDRTQEENHKNR